jgi:hypothetical protein
LLDKAKLTHLESLVKDRFLSKIFTDKPAAFPEAFQPLWVKASVVKTALRLRRPLWWLSEERRSAAAGEMGF